MLVLVLMMVLMLMLLMVLCETCCHVQCAGCTMLMAVSGVMAATAQRSDWSPRSTQAEMHD
mgnify:CR=1 FL=1